MRKFLSVITVAGLLAPFAASVVEAGPINRACLKSGRKAASSQLCGCIQVVADTALSWGDQRRAAKFFKDPHRAQEIRQSDRARDEEFWLRYKAFGSRAEATCRGY